MLKVRTVLGRKLNTHNAGDHSPLSSTIILVPSSLTAPSHHITYAKFFQFFLQYIFSSGLSCGINIFIILTSWANELGLFQWLRIDDIDGVIIAKIILYADTDRIRESLFREEGSITKIDNVQ